MKKLPDGSLPTGFARLVAGSDLIDRGVDVGLPFHGTAPDLGPYEFLPSLGLAGFPQPTIISVVPPANNSSRAFSPAVMKQTFVKVGLDAVCHGDHSLKGLLYLQY